MGVLGTAPYILACLKMFFLTEKYLRKRIGSKKHKPVKLRRIIIGSDRRPETKQGIEGKIDRFRSGRVGDRVRVRYN